MIALHTVEAVKALDIVSVIGNYVQLKKKGANFWAISPFSPNEKTPSFTVSPSKQIFKCFSTGTGGDAIHFVMEHKGIDFITAIQEIANANNVSIEYENIDTEELKQKAETREIYYKINASAKRKYWEALIETDGNHPAFKELIDKRGYTADTILQWGIGYAPGDTTGFEPKKWKYLTKPMIDNGFYEHGIHLGLIKQKNEQAYDAMRHRIIFPIWDNKSRIVGFGGRALTDSEETPKYINSPESEIYHKSKVLYGLNYATHSIMNYGFAYLTEGYTDVISMHQNGMENTVGTCGTSLTLEQAKLLKKYTSKVVLLYDGDEAGKKAAIKAMDIFLRLDMEVHIVKLPKQHDPDSFLKSGAGSHQLIELQEVGILFKADFLLSDENNPIIRDEKFNDVARSLALIDRVIARADYGKSVAKKYKIDWSTFKKMIDDQIIILERDRKMNNEGYKNKVVELEESRERYPFFEEVYTQKGDFDKIIINKLKFIRLLSSFGYTRYEIADDNYTFVQINDNLIKNVQRDEIIDRIEKFILEEYDFDGAEMRVVDGEMLLNKFYDGMNRYFSKDLFARVRLDKPIIINKDDFDCTFFYYKNGFVKVTKDGYELKPYEDLNGSVWAGQIVDREFKPIELELKDGTENPIEGTYDKHTDTYKLDAGIFADFVFRVCGASGFFEPEATPEQRLKSYTRFKSLCSIIGYLVHDYYQYKMKAVLLTDSSLSDDADGRTGKTLLGKLIGQVRAYTEINGKDFDTNDRNKYQDATIGTQIIHLNDVSNRGRNKFDFESVFNDVTEGYMVKHLYMHPFRVHSKMMISTNKTLKILGGSQRDRIIEFEMSDFFNENKSPQDFYGHWMMRDWDDKEWQRFDNFICWCAQLFLREGLIEPSSINLEIRKLKDHTAEEFIEFMKEVRHTLEQSGKPFENYSDTAHQGPVSIKFSDYKFDKKQLFNHFIEEYEDFKSFNWMNQRLFTKWLRLYSELILDIRKPIETRSNGESFIQFKKS